MSRLGGMFIMGDTLRSLARSCCCMASPQCALFLVGLAFYWSLWREPFLGTLYSTHLSAAYEARLWYYALLFGGGVLVVAFPSRRSRLPMGVYLACGVVASAGAAVILLASLAPSDAEPVLLAGSCAVALGFMGLSMGWMTCLVEMDRTRAAFLVFASFALSFVLGFLDLVPGLLEPLVAAMPFCSGVLLVVAWRKGDGRGVSEGPSEGSSEDVSGGTFAETHSGKRDPSSADPFATDNRSDAMPAAEREGQFRGVLLATSIAVCIAAGLLSSCMRSLWLYDAPGYEASPMGMVTYAESFLMGCAFLLIRFKTGDFLAALMAGLAAVMGCFLVGLLVCSFVGVPGGLGFVSTAHTSLQFLLWVAVAQMSIRQGVHVAGVLFVVESALSVLVMYLLPRMFGITGANYAAFAFPIALWGMVFVAVAGVALTAGFLARLLGKGSQGDAGAAASSDVSSRTSSECAASGDESGLAREEAELSGLPYREELARALSARYALTEREAQVAALLARGNSIKRTAQLLCLAPSTVQGYTKTIYRKMGIHRKQELVDIASRLSSAEE